MNMKNVVSSLFILLILTACDNKAKPVDESLDAQPQQQQYEQGTIDTHGSD